MGKNTVHRVTAKDATEATKKRNAEIDRKWSEKRLERRDPGNVPVAELRALAESLREPVQPDEAALRGYTAGVRNSDSVAGKFGNGVGFGATLVPMVAGMFKGGGRDSPKRSSRDLSRLLKLRYPYYKDARAAGDQGAELVKGVLDAYIRENAEYSGIPEHVVRRIEMRRAGERKAENYPPLFGEELLGKAYDIRQPWYRKNRIPGPSRSATVSPGHDNLYLVRGEPVESVDKDLHRGNMPSPSMGIARRGLTPPMQSTGIDTGNPAGAYAFIDRNALSELIRNGDAGAIVAPYDAYQPTASKILERGLPWNVEMQRFMGKIPSGWSLAPLNYGDLAVLSQEYPFLSEGYSKYLSEFISYKTREKLAGLVKGKYHEGLPMYDEANNFMGMSAATPAEKLFVKKNAGRVGALSSGGLPEWKMFGDVPLTGKFFPGFVFTGRDENAYSGVRRQLERRGIETRYIPVDESVTADSVFGGRLPYRENIELKKAVDDFQRPFHQDSKGGEATPSVHQDYGKRPDGTKKGKGWLGELKLPNGGTATEYSIGVNIDGKETLIPSLVPTLTKKQIAAMVNDIIPNMKMVPDEIVRAAALHAKERIAKGESVWAPVTNDVRSVRQDAQGGDADGVSPATPEPSAPAPAPDGATNPNPGKDPDYRGPRIAVNPAVFKDKRDALCVAMNEAYRIIMEMNGFEPQAEPTEAQRRFFADTAYANDELQLRRTILARICTFDTSVQ